MNKVPAQLGFRLPAEWERHQATWLSWPHKKESWPGKFEPIPAIWKSLVETLVPHEAVCIAAAGDAHAEATQMVGHIPNVSIFDIPTDDCWMRDHGPIFLVHPEKKSLAAVKWHYNAWGGKYPPFDQDERVAHRVCEALRVPLFEADLILEGGAIDGNGAGTLLTTEECLLNPNRNPGYSRDEIERLLKLNLGAGHIIWLGKGIRGDDTDGHIDELARFVGPTTVVAIEEKDPQDENYKPLEDNLQRLARARTQSGQALEVVRLPLPRPLFQDDQRLPASYANFYIANNVVIVPQFDDPADRVAIETLSRCFPGRRVIGLAARDLVWGLGAFHCITQQQPALPV